MIFTPALNSLYCYQGIGQGFSSTFAVSVFAGTQPTAQQIVDNWATTYMDTHLVHWQGAAWLYSNVDQILSPQIIQLAATLAAVTAAHTGTMSWGILWASNVTEATVQGSVLPNTNFIVVPASDFAGTGVIRLASTSIVSGTGYPLSDISLSIDLAS